MRAPLWELPRHGAFQVFTSGLLVFRVSTHGAKHRFESPCLLTRLFSTKRLLERMSFTNIVDELVGSRQQNVAVSAESSSIGPSRSVFDGLNVAQPAARHDNVIDLTLECSSDEEDQQSVSYNAKTAGVHWRALHPTAPPRIARQANANTAAARRATRSNVVLEHSSAPLASVLKRAKLQGDDNDGCNTDQSFAHQPLPLEMLLSCDFGFDMLEEACKTAACGSCVNCQAFRLQFVLPDIHPSPQAALLYWEGLQARASTRKAHENPLVVPGVDPGSAESCDDSTPSPIPPCPKIDTIDTGLAVDVLAGFDMADMLMHGHLLSAHAALEALPVGLSEAESGSSAGDGRSCEQEPEGDDDLDMDLARELACIQGFEELDAWHSDVAPDPRDHEEGRTDQGLLARSGLVEDRDPAQVAARGLNAPAHHHGGVQSANLVVLALAALRFRQRDPELESNLNAQPGFIRSPALGIASEAPQRFANGGNGRRQTRGSIRRAFVPNTTAQFNMPAMFPFPY